MTDDASLREAWATLGHSPPATPCPDAAELFDAANGGLSAMERAAVIDHIAVCGPCSEAWRIACSVGNHEEKPATNVRSFGVMAVAALAMAAALVLTMRVQENPWRATTVDGQVVASIAEGAALDRASFRLAWVGGATGERYVVHISNANLDPLHRSDPVATQVYQVPADVFEGLGPGTRLYWQVETLHPDGNRTRSTTYAVVVQ